MRRVLVALVAALLAAGCGGDPNAPGTPRSQAGGKVAYSFGPPPRARDGPLDPDVDRASARLVRALTDGELDRRALSVLAGSGDARVGWLLSDVLRFTPPGDAQDRAVSASLLRRSGRGRRLAPAVVGRRAHR